MPSSADCDYLPIFEAASDGLIVTDPGTGLVVTANAAFCRLHGCDTADIVGGLLRVESAPGRGTRLRAVLPMPASV